MAGVLVVAAEDLERAGLTALLRAAPAQHTVIEAGIGEDGVEAVAATRPDIVILYLPNPDIDGVRTIKRMSAQASAAPPHVLILTRHASDEFLHTALRIGVGGILLKNTPTGRLYAAVDSVAAGEPVFSPSITRRLIQAYTHGSTKRFNASFGPNVPTPREQDVFHLVARGMSNTDIARRLSLAEATVKTHMYRAMTKLGLTSRAQVVAYAYETGLIAPRATQPPSPSDTLDRGPRGRLRVIDGGDTFEVGDRSY